MNDIVLVVWNVLFEDRACGNDIVVFVWIVVDVAIEDFNWYVMIMIIMMILIWDDVVNKDHVNMNWCYCWWLCEYEMRSLLLLITSLRRDDVYVENDMKMECWLMLEMYWHMHVMYVHGGMHWPCRTTHSWGTRVVKESKHSLRGCLGALICPWSLHLMVPMFDTLDVVYVRGGGVHWPCRMAHSWGTSVVKESKHFWGDA